MDYSNAYSISPAKPLTSNHINLEHLNMSEKIKKMASPAASSFDEDGTVVVGLEENRNSKRMDKNSSSISKGRRIVLLNDSSTGSPHISHVGGSNYYETPTPVKNLKTGYVDDRENVNPYKRENGGNQRYDLLQELSRPEIS